MPLAVVVLSVAHVIVFNKIRPSAATPGATWVIVAIEQIEPTMLVGQQVGPVRSPELLTCLTLEVTALGAAAHTSESGNVEIPLLELPLPDGNSRQLCLHLNSEPAVQEMPCFNGYVGSRSGVLDRLPTAMGREG